MTDPNATETVIEQGKALVRAIEALGTIGPAGWFERAIAGLLVPAYKQRLWAIIEVAPVRVGEKMSSASQHIRDQRAAVWMSDN